MSSEEKLVARGRQTKEQASLHYSSMPLRKKRGRKPRSLLPSTPPTNPGPLSFFKVLVGDFGDTLFIPPMVSCILKGLAKKYVCIKDTVGNHWYVKISMVDGSLAFQNGWHDFVSDHSITVGEFILFTYTGGLLFTARIFGTFALERVDFKMKTRKGRRAKERCTTELNSVSVRIPKRKASSLASEEQHILSGKVLRSLTRKRKSVECDFPKVHVIESDSTSEGFLEISGEGEKPLDDSNSKESYNTLHDFEQTLHRNSDALVGEIIVVSLAELENSDVENIEAVASKSSINRMSTTEKGTPLLRGGGALLSEPTAEEPDTMTKTATWAVEAHSEIKVGSPEMNGSQAQMNEEHDEMRNKGKIEQDLSNDHEMLNSKPHAEKMASLSIVKHAECSPKMEFTLIKPEGVAEESFFLADAICYTTFDEKLRELATGASFNTNGQDKPTCPDGDVAFSLETSVPCETISVVSSNPMLDHTTDEKESMISISGASQTKGSSAIAESGLQSSNKGRECKYKSYPEFVKGSDCQSGIAHDAFFDVDDKNVTPCSHRSRQVKADIIDSDDIPSSSCVSFSVCLSDDVQSFLELQKKLGCHIGALKYERKVVVLEDLSMRCWPVLYHQSKNFIGFLGGWADFAKRNNFCRGDICEFELVDKIELKFRVQITKAEGSNLIEKVE